MSGVESRRPIQSDSSTSRFTTAVVGMLFGLFVGQIYLIVAKLIHYRKGEGIVHWKLVESSLYILILAMVCAICVCLILLNTKRLGRRQFSEHVILFSGSTLVVACFTIVDQGLPEVAGAETLPIWRSLYYLGWPIMLWFVFPWLLLNDGGNDRLQRVGSLIVVSLLVGAICGLIGLGFERFVSELVASTGLLGGVPGRLIHHKEIWLGRPIAVNFICGMFLVVTFVRSWLPQIRFKWQRWGVVGWQTLLVGFAILYSGLFGGVFYGDADGEALFSWFFFIQFSLIPVVGVLGFKIAQFITHGPESASRMTGSFGGGIRFWLVLSVGLGVGFAAIQLLGLLPYGRFAQAEWRLVAVIVLCHAANGCVLGMSLQVLNKIGKWMLVRPCEAENGVKYAERQSE